MNGDGHNIKFEIKFYKKMNQHYWSEHKLCVFSNRYIQNIVTTSFDDMITIIPHVLRQLNRSFTHEWESRTQTMDTSCSDSVLSTEVVIEKAAREEDG